VHRSSASRLKIHSWEQWATASFRSRPNPWNGICTIRSVYRFAISTVRSALKESATTISSAHPRVLRAASILSSSLYVRI
jgi:hypothetical protein